MRFNKKKTANIEAVLAAKWHSKSQLLRFTNCVCINLDICSEIIEQFIYVDSHNTPFSYSFF